MNKKEFYTSPEVETFVVRYEGVVCGSGKLGINDWEEKNDFPTGF